MGAVWPAVAAATVAGVFGLIGVWFKHWLEGREKKSAETPPAVVDMTGEAVLTRSQARWQGVIIVFAAPISAFFMARLLIWLDLGGGILHLNNPVLVNDVGLAFRNEFILAGLIGLYILGKGFQKIYRGG